MGRRSVTAVLVLLSACRFHFDGAADDGGIGGTDDGAATGDATDGPNPTETFNIVFVTSSSARLADLGSVAAADTVCNDLARAENLPGTYVAWLSDASMNAKDRLAGARGWVRVDGKPVVDTVDDLLAGRILHPILLTETGTAVTGQFGIHTATNRDGLRAEDCLGYTSTAMGDSVTAGIASTTRDNWTDNLPVNCSGASRHYCFGIDQSVPLTYAPVAGRRAFVTASLWAPDSGVANADTTCQAAADAKALGGTWRALMSTTTETAASRFSDGLPWVRLDGVAIASDAMTLLTGQNLDAPLNLTETGMYMGSNPATSGATSTTALGAANSTCVDWSSNSAGDSQRVGLLNSVTLYFSTLIFQTCSSGGGALYCLEP